MVILQRFANLIVKFSQVAIEVPTEDAAKLQAIHNSYKKLYNDIIAAREDTTNLGGSDPPMFYQKTCPNGYAKVCVARGIPVPSTGNSVPDKKNKDRKNKDKRGTKDPKSKRNEKGGGNDGARGILVAIDTKKDLTNLKSIPKLKDKKGVSRSLCIHGCFRHLKCAFASRPKGCQKFHFDDDDDFLSVSSDDQAKIDRLVKDNKKVISFHKGYAAKDRKKETADAGPSEETQPATVGEEGE
jgi:hypothetical protein